MFFHLSAFPNLPTNFLKYEILYRDVKNEVKILEVLNSLHEELLNKTHLQIRSNTWLFSGSYSDICTW